MQNKYSSVEAYIAGHPPAIGTLLSEIRAIIRETAPAAVEGISYGMPAYKLHQKPLAYFAAFARHIGLYATPSCHEAFAAELTSYKTGKGSVQFPLDKPLPSGLIRRMVAFRAATIEGGQALQKKGRTPGAKRS